MTESAIHPTEFFLRFSRGSMLAMLLVVLILGGTALSLMLAPSGAIGRASDLGWWLIPVVVAAVIAVGISLRRRRWSPDAPEVQTVMEDELRRANLLKASRVTLIALRFSGRWPSVFRRSPGCPPSAWP